MLTWVLVWVFGISLTVISSCSSSSEEKQTKEPEFEDLDQEEENDFSLEDLTEQNQTENTNYESIHPKDSNPWTLKAMIMTVNRPADEDMIRCRNEIFALSQDSFNEASLLTAQQKMIPEFKENRIRYHWCFYYSMMTLDTKLNSDALGVTMKSKLASFQKEMKTLWILARGLDQAYQTEEYFTYLRKRYLTISKKHFSRPLEIYAPPIGQGRKNPQQKPAAEFE